MLHKILIIDDESEIRAGVRGILEDEGYGVLDAEGADAALPILAGESPPDLVILDVWLKTGDHDGLDLLAKIRKKYPRLPVLMMSGHGTIEMAVTAMKHGAYDFIEKPFQVDRMILTIERALDAAHLREQNKNLREQIDGPADLIGASHAIALVRAAVDRVAPTGARVFLSGPSGVGKEVVARLIHRLSPRAGRPFVAIACGGGDGARIEQDLFGNAHHPGFIHQADGGTLFLDEVQDVPADIQAKLLRVLQDHKYQHAVTGAWIEADVRVISSASKDVVPLVAGGTFRQDLFYRLNVVTIDIPPIVDRRDDVPLFLDHYMRVYADVVRKPVRAITPAAMAALQLYNWPGNVRQLKNVAEWLVVMGAGDADTPIDLEGLPPEITQTAGAAAPHGVLHLPPDLLALPLRDAREVFERTYLQAQIARFGGSVTRAANFVGMERSALHRKIKLLAEGTDGADAVNDDNRDVA
jgi:two-component system nitrogen regulation response regulator NtrX